MKQTTKVKNHFAHYLKRKVKMRFSKREIELFYKQNQNLEDGFDKPKYHITRRKSGPVTRIKTGDIIWLFSILESPWGEMPPSLDAKIIVEEVRRTKEGYYKFIAGPDSVWFNLNDATKCIAQIKTIDSKGNIKNLITKEKNILGKQLQSIRQIKNEKSLLDYLDVIENKGFDFVSYRIKDGTKLAFLKVIRLLEQGKIVFWDRYCLPRRLAERREYVSDCKLDDHLIGILKKSETVWGIETKCYAVKNSYSIKEKETAIELKKYKPG